MIRIAAGAGVYDGGDDCSARAGVTLSAAFVGDFDLRIAIFRGVGSLPVRG